MRVKIKKEVLTDKSEVFSVVLLGHDQVYVLPAVTEKDAEALANIIVEAVNKHSCQVAKFGF